MSSRLSVTAYLIVVAFAAGCSDSPTPPTAPIIRAEALIIGGIHSLEEGESATLSLSVRLSSGASKAVAGGAWSSENPSTATVTEGGVVTAVATGSAGIRATFDGLSATTTLTVSPGPRIVGGFVRESAPTETVGIAGAAVTVLDAKGVTQSAVSDATGRFSLRLPIGATRFTVTAPGYQDGDRSTEVGVDAAPVSLALMPVLREVREDFGNWDQWDGRTYAGGPRREVSFSIVAHNPGTIRMDANACVGGCLASEKALLCAEIRDGSNRLLAFARGQYDLAPTIPNVEIKGGERYQLKLGVCDDRPGFLMNRFAIGVKHPS